MEEVVRCLFAVVSSSSQTPLDFVTDQSRGELMNSKEVNQYL